MKRSVPVGNGWSRVLSRRELRSHRRKHWARCRVSEAGVKCEGVTHLVLVFCHVQPQKVKKPRSNGAVYHAMSVYRRLHSKRDRKCEVLSLHPKGKAPLLHAFDQADLPELTIHLVGHGLSGNRYFGFKEDKLFTSAVELVDELIRRGLPASRPIKLKLNACYSGVAEHDDTPLYVSVGQALSKKGYKNVRVYGYRGQLEESMCRTHTLCCVVYPGTLTLTTQVKAGQAQNCYDTSFVGLG